MWTDLQFYPFPPRAGADFDDLGRELDADGLRGQDPPLALDEAMQQTRLARAAGPE